MRKKGCLFTFVREIPLKRHVQFRKQNGGLYRVEVTGIYIRISIRIFLQKIKRCIFAPDRKYISEN